MAVVTTVAVAPMPTQTPMQTTRRTMLRRPTKLIAYQRSRLRPGVRKAAIVFTIVGHVIVITAMLAFVKLHMYIQNSSQLRIDFQQVGTQMLEYFESVKTACFTAAACHVVMLLYALQTYFLRWLEDEVSTTESQAVMECLSSNLRSQSEKPSLWRRIYRRVDCLLTVYPTETAQVRLLVEIALQIFQANKMSELVATVWLNRLLVIVIVLNCWFTPLIFLAMRNKSLYAKRVFRLCVDTVLDMVYSIGIPSVILYPYYRDFDVDVKMFPVAFFVMDAWTSVTAAELRQIFISSTMDFVSKVCPWFFVCYRLQALRNLLVTKGKHVRQESRSRLSRVLNTVLVLCGVVVLVIHLLATQLATSSSVARGCLVEMRPWLATSYTCTVVEISCSQYQISGRKPEIDAIFSGIALDHVQGLVVSHCPHFEMPPTILSLRQVAMLKFYNSTVVDWRKDAAISATTNPNVQQFFAVETNFTTFPDGLLSPDSLKTMRDVKFVATNLTKFPVELAQAWSEVKYFAVELCAWSTTVSPTLAEFPYLQYLSLGGNQIESIPDQLLQNASIRQMLVGDNPLTSLPEFVGEWSIFRWLAMTRTSVRELPSTWLATKDDPRLPSVKILADETPLCKSLLSSQTLEADGSVRQAFAFGRFTIDCADTSETFMTDLYPLKLERIWREVNRHPV